MKKLFIIALAALMLTSCGMWVRDPVEAQEDVPRVTTSNSRKNRAPTADISKLDLENVLKEFPALGNYDIVASFGHYFCGYDYSVMAGDGSNFYYYTSSGDKVEPEALSEDLSGEILYGLKYSCVSSGGDLYLLTRPFGEEDRLCLVKIDGEGLKAELLGEIPFTLERTILPTLVPIDGGVILTTKETNVDFDVEPFVRYCTFTAWLYDDENGFREVISESMSETDAPDSSGVEVFSVFIKDGELWAVGRGKKDGKNEVAVLRYDLFGNFLGAKRIVNCDESEKLCNMLYIAQCAYQIGDGIGVGIYNGDHAIIKDGGYTYIENVHNVRNTEFLLTYELEVENLPVNTNNCHIKSVTLYDLESGESRAIPDVDSTQGRVVHIVAVEEGFLAQAETENGMTYLKVTNETLKMLFE